MEMDEQAFIEAIESDNYQQTKSETELDLLEKNPKEALKPLNDFIAQNIKDDQIACAQLEVHDEDIHIKLLTSIINLPLEYGPQINKIMVNDGVVPMNVYMVIQNPYVTHSKLRIDEMDTSDAVAKDPDGKLLDKFADWVLNRLDDIKINKKDAEEAEKDKK